MTTLHIFLEALKTKNLEEAERAVRQVMREKIHARLSEERKTLFGGPQKPTPKPLPKDARDQKEPICVNCEKPGSKCDCEPHGVFV